MDEARWSGGETNLLFYNVKTGKLFGEIWSDRDGKWFAFVDGNQVGEYSSKESAQNAIEVRYHTKGGNA